MSSELAREEMITRYLLGGLAEDQQIEIEERAFSDEQYRQLITAVENDLIDEYVRGELPETERRQFERRFLTSAGRRQRVEFARALTTLFLETAPTEVARPAVLPAATWRDSLAAFFGGFTPAFRFSMVAAALLLFVVGAWLVTQTLRQRAELARLQSEEQLRQNERQALQQQIENERKRNEDLTAQLEHEKQQRRQSEEAINQLRQTDNSVLRPVLSLVLLPGIARSGGVRPKLAITESARIVRLQVGVEPEEPYQTFQVVVRNQNGKQVWSRDNLPARTTRSGKTISLTLPASVLSLGQYELTLKGVTEGKTTEEVGYYYFDVVKK